MGVGRGGGNAQGLELGARRRPEVAIEIVGFQMVPIHRPLMQAHRNAIDVPDFFDNFLADVLFAAALAARQASQKMSGSRFLTGMAVRIRRHLGHI